MSSVNLMAREVGAKIVFYGPGLSGKTTTLRKIYETVRPAHRGEMMSLATEGDRTLFFDFLPVKVEKVGDCTVRLALYTVPGQVFYNATRKLVLQGADGVVFVADSQPAAADSNRESLQNLEENLLEQGLRLDRFPLVIQYNKRDVPGVLPVERLRSLLNPRGRSRRRDLRHERPRRPRRAQGHHPPGDPGSAQQADRALRPSRVRDRPDARPSRLRSSPASDRAPPARGWPASAPSSMDRIALEAAPVGDARRTTASDGARPSLHRAPGRAAVHRDPGGTAAEHPSLAGAPPCPRRAPSVAPAPTGRLPIRAGAEPRPDVTEPTFDDGAATAPRRRAPHRR